jgi:hypothetical protein
MAISGNFKRIRLVSALLLKAEIEINCSEVLLLEHLTRQGS